MALFNESLAGRFNKAIARMHGVKGGPPAPQNAPEINHGITLENDRPEQLIHQETNLWAMRQITGASAGNLSFAGIRNPAGSGLLIVITEMKITNSGAVT